MIHNAPNRSEIEDVIQNYFDALFNSNVKLLDEVFHEASSVTGYVGKDNLAIMTLDEFRSFVETVPSPNQAGTEYDMEILTLEETGDVAAAKVRNFYLNKCYTDYLHLVKTAAGWKITSKTFHAAKTK